jgi:hypothetical protein
MIRELVTKKVDWREIGLLLAIATATSFITLGVLECLFNNVSCIRVKDDGTQDTIYGFNNCAPIGVQEPSSTSFLRSETPRMPL